MGRSALMPLVIGALAVAAVLAIAISPWASSSPDGLERVAIDNGFEARATDHDLAASPLADYTAAGVDNERVTVSVAGVIGVALTFAATTGLVWWAARALRRRRPVTA